MSFEIRLPSQRSSHEKKHRTPFAPARSSAVAVTATDAADGFARYGEQRETPHHVFARQAPTDDEGVSRVEVLLASEPLPEAACVGGGNLEELARAGLFMGLLAKISPEGYATQSALLHRDEQFRTNWDLEQSEKKLKALSQPAV